MPTRERCGNFLEPSTPSPQHNVHQLGAHLSFPVPAYTFLDAIDGMTSLLLLFLITTFITPLCSKGAGYSPYRTPSSPCGFAGSGSCLPWARERFCAGVNARRNETRHALPDTPCGWTTALADGGLWMRLRGGLGSGVDCAARATLSRPHSPAANQIEHASSIRAPLRLRGGDMGPRAELEPEDGDLLVHHVSPDMPRPSHRCLRSALHRSRKNNWNGRRIYVSSSYTKEASGSSVSSQNRYYWEKPIRIGTMQFGSGNESMVRVAGDDKVQLWGQWQFAGPTSGIYQGLFCMYTNYGPYKPLMLIEKYANVLFQQVCESHSR